MAKGDRGFDTEVAKVREMRDAETVLGIIRERGRRGLPLEDVYRQLFNPTLYLLAYGKLARNAGALTPGSTAETADSMSRAKIDAIIEAVRWERYRWTPVRRVYIEKKNSTKKRPLGMPTWSDKLLQEVIRMLLEAYYEPQFSDHSHGFRPERGCHTTLQEIRDVWTGTTWFIEGDISACFDSIDHATLLSILRERIKDNRFLGLIEGLLRAGYLEEWTYHKTYSGTPQGGIVSPILANIYLDRLDRFVELTLLPRYTRGDERRHNPAYQRLQRQRSRAIAQGDRAKARNIQQAQRTVPSGDPQDPAYRRLRYVRYADDFLLGFAGPHQEAEDIKVAIGAFLRNELRLELSDNKTKVTHARSERARFLGYDIKVIQADDRLSGTHRQRNANGKVGLMVPPDVIQTKCSRYMVRSKVIHRRELEDDTVFDIIVKYQTEYRGLTNYYALAYDRAIRLSKLRWTMHCSLLKTLAAKLKLTRVRVAKRYGTIIQTPSGPRKVLQTVVPRPGQAPLVATWGGISLSQERRATLHDTIDFRARRHDRVELIQRLLADTCELCGSQDRVQVHHVRHLKDLQRPGQPERPRWVMTMAARRRKTLVLCQPCHAATHAGDPQRQTRTRNPGEPDAVKAARPVRRGADGKVPA